MRVPQFFRRRGATPKDAHAPAAEPTGLDAFATEAPTSPRPNREPMGQSGGSRSLIIVLGALVLLQAVPTALWIRGRLSASATAVAVLPPPSDSQARGLDPSIMAAPPCEAGSASGPAPTKPKSAPAVPAATSGRFPITTAAASPRPETKGTVAGLVAIASPVAMRIYSGGRLMGTTEAETILLPVGTHQLEFVNEAVGYRDRRSVTVQAGRTTNVRLEPPSGSLHVNAVPWAEVWLDNQRIGETPIGNVPARIGTREVVFRHPDLGERRATVMVTLREPARISMDLRKR